MRKLKNNESGFSAVEGILILVVVAIIGGIGWYIYSANKKTSNIYSSATQNSQSTVKFAKAKAKTQATSSYATLSPATVPSKVATCSQALTTAQDGTVGSLSCSNGDLNTTAWQYIAGHYSLKPPSVMALGYSSTCQQVLTAMGKDGSSGTTTKPMEEDAETISAQYYGWSFATNPITAYANQEDSC